MARKIAGDVLDELDNDACRALLMALLDEVPGTVDAVWRRMGRDRGGRGGRDYRDTDIVGPRHEADAVDRWGSGRDQEWARRTQTHARARTRESGLASAACYVPPGIQKR